MIYTFIFTLGFELKQNRYERELLEKNGTLNGSICHACFIFKMYYTKELQFLRKYIKKIVNIIIEYHRIAIYSAF